MIINQMNWYQAEAVKTAQLSADLVYLSGKLVVEAAELSQMILKHTYHGAPLDTPHMMEEIGDTLWYIAVLCDRLGVDMAAVAGLNIEKLRARHGETYNPAHYQQELMP